MSTHERSLIGSVFERTTLHPPSVPSPRFAPMPSAGFPPAEHRFKSTFARARARDSYEAHLKDNGGGARRTEVHPVVMAASQAHPRVAPTAPIVDSKPIPTDSDALRRQIHEENARRIAHMTEDEIEAEKRAIVDQLGEGTGELLRRVQEARWRKEAKERVVQAVIKEKEGGLREEKMTNGESTIASPAPHRMPHGLAAKPGVLRVKSLENIGKSVPSPLPATSSTRPSSRTGRRLRFAEVTPDDVHVYESTPRSPKQNVLALPPPPDTKDDSIISLGTFNQKTIPFRRSYPTDESTKDPARPIRATEADEPEEGTPEYIRRRYFPDVLANDPSLAWMERPAQETTDVSATRFDLQGAPIPASLSVSLPSHLGLHHHAQGNQAGYTLDDILLLSRSTVPAQRASMLGILAKIAHRLSRQVRHPDDLGQIVAFAGQESEFRKRILAAGLASIDQIGSLGARAAEVIWECLVEWDRPTSGLGGVELALAPDIVSSLQLDHFLPQIADVFSHAALPSESRAQLLTVIHWLAQQSNHVADAITHTPRLISTILDTFLLTPIPPREDSLPPNPLALQLLITLASASRGNALALLDLADALLRFVAVLPTSSPYSPALASTLLTYTLRFYTTLASYGLYSHIATTASQVFATLASYVFSTPSESVQLRTAWASLVQAWTVCATDPHATSPPHEILWSQVRAWGWATDVRKLREGVGSERSDWAVHAAIWDAEAAWLQGSRINGIKGGDIEREEALQTLRSTFSAQDGTEFGIVQRALKGVQRDLAREGPTTIQEGQRVLESLASAGTVLASALGLFLACLPTLNDDILLSAPPFALPLSELSALSATLVRHPIWSLPATLGAAHLQVYLRPMTRFLVQFHRVSRYIPGTTPQLWFAQAVVFLSCLLPGDESYALAMLDAFSFVTPRFVGVDSAEIPQDVHVDVLRPFFEYSVRPEGRAYVAPLGPSTESISRSSTCRLPRRSGDDHHGQPFAAGLPLARDFLFGPLTHLLRSGTSPVFRALPGNWGASEVEVVRATLSLVFAARRALVGHGLQGFVYDAAEVVFGCMRVCMLEHGVGTGGAEVFRDGGVEQLMRWLLEPFTVRGRQAATTNKTARTLEEASASYLGSTPFYQFYTDLVALYGSVSFGHGVFAALVVTPLAMRYATDYRRALWCGGEGASSGPGAGLGDIVRSVRIPIEDVVCTGADTDVREYLYPVERDGGVLGAYVVALVKAEVEGFLRFVAVHHIACVLWGDLETEDEERGSEEMRSRMLRTVLVRGDVDVVRDVVLYRQCMRRAVVLPPTCYRGGEDEGERWREGRLGVVRQSMGESGVDQVQGLLMPTT